MYNKPSRTMADMEVLENQETLKINGNGPDLEVDQAEQSKKKKKKKKKKNTGS